MECRRPLSGDFEQIVTLQNKYLVSALKPTEQSDGFLSAAFSAQQFQSMDNDLCVFICTDAEKVCAYVCASSIEDSKQVPLIAAMLKRFPDIIYNEKPLAAYHACVYGPVCIDSEYRGKGVLENMFKKMLEYLLQQHPQLELLAALISTDNPRSIEAHTKLGMETVGQFEFNGKMFLILIYPLISITKKGG